MCNIGDIKASIILNGSIIQFAINYDETMNYTYLIAPDIVSVAKWLVISQSKKIPDLKCCFK